MPRLDMEGAFPLTKEEIDRQIPEGEIGNYAFGNTVKDNAGNKAFCVRYVGRADREPLRDRIKHGIKDGYSEFKFSIAKTKKEAYEKECKNWHDFGGLEGCLDNKIHPDKPDGTDYECPYCNNK